MVWPELWLSGLTLRPGLPFFPSCSGQALPDSQSAGTNFARSALQRHGPACPGQPRPHPAAIGGPDKPGHDDIGHDRRKSFPRFLNPVGASPTLTKAQQRQRPIINPARFIAPPAAR